METKQKLKEEIISQLKLNPTKPATIEIDFCPKVHPLFQEILLKHTKHPINENKTH